jgi:hypothetical protein
MMAYLRGGYKGEKGRRVKDMVLTRRKLRGDTSDERYDDKVNYEDTDIGM